MSQKISLFQRAWDVVHFLLCLGVVGLLLVYLTREFWHGAPPLETADTTAQVAGEPDESVVPNASVVIEASTVSVTSGTPVALDVPAMSVTSGLPVALDVPAVSVTSGLPVALDVPAVSVTSGLPVALDVPAVSVTSGLPVALDVPAVSVTSSAPVALDVPAMSVTSGSPIALDVPSVSVVSNAPVVLEVPSVSVVSSAPIVLEAPVAPEEQVIFEIPDLPDEPVVSDVSVAGLKSIAIRPDSPVFQELHIVTVKQAETTDPIVTVTGVNVASLQQSKAGSIENGLVSVEKQPDFKFHSPELLAAFTDWQKAVDDITFAEKQLQLVEEHFKTIIDASKQKVALLEEEVKGGTEAKKTLDDARAELSKKEFEWQKEVLAAQATLQHAQRDKTKFEKLLELAGFQAELLVSTPRDVDMIMAEVPESMIKHAQVGQKCVARFFSHPGKEFNGKVHSVVPVLSKESPSLRVLFAIDDADDVLHAGMLAEIGLGIESRLVLRVPQEAVVSIDDSNYVLVRKNATDWNVAEVQIGELRETGVEVFSGLKDGDQVVGKGARLLKQVVAESLQLK